MELVKTAPTEEKVPLFDRLGRERIQTSTSQLYGDNNKPL